jgi:hypothetical protein
VNLALACLKHTLGQVALPIYDEQRPETDSLRHIQLAVERKTGRVQLVLVGYREHYSARRGRPGSKLSRPWRLLCQRIWEQGHYALHGKRLWHSIWVHLHTGKGNAIFASMHQVTEGETALWEQVYGAEPYLIDEPLAGEQGAVMVFPPFAFQQANLGAYRALIQDLGAWCADQWDPNGPVTNRLYALTAHASSPTRTRPVQYPWRRYVKDSRKEIRIAEFCAGVGAIGQSVLCQLRAGQASFPKMALWASDLQPKCRDAFWEAARRNGLVQETDALELDYQVGSLQTLARRIHEPDVAATLVIADPPRAGLGSLFIQEALLQPPPHSRLQRFIYVSCSVPSFIRDVEQLVAAQRHELSTPRQAFRWVLRHAQPYVFFPGTDHLELYAVFDRCSIDT